VDSLLDSTVAQEYTGQTGMRHVPLAAWGGSINRRSAEGSERVSGMEDLVLVRGPQAFWGLSHLRDLALDFSVVLRRELKVGAGQPRLADSTGWRE
jgi:hypothetical protein